MSVLSIAPYFPFRRIKIVKQTVFPNAGEARIKVEPDKRFQPICHFCGQKATAVHSWTQRTIRDLNLATAYMPLSKAVLSSLPSCQYRGFRTVSSLPAGDQSPGSLHLSVVSVYDCHRSRSTCRFGLENRQKYRQNVFRSPAKARLTRL